MLILSFCFVFVLLIAVIQDYLSRGIVSSFDLSVSAFFYQIRTPVFVRIFYFVTLFAESGVVIALSLLLGSFLWLKKQRVTVEVFVSSLVFSEAITFLGKIYFHRLRPNAALQAIHETSFSFPSGHATTVVVFYGFLAYLLLRTFRTWFARCLIVATCVSAIVLVDVSRLYLDVHYLSDVIAGNLVGLAGLLFAILLQERFIKIDRSKDENFLFRWKHAAWIGLAALLVIIPFFLSTTFPVSSIGKTIG